MTGKKILRGMAWDHPRARSPLEAISNEWSAGGEFSVEWQARPLKDFEDQPLEELATAYDIVLIDYPFVGRAASSGLIVPVDEWVDAAYLADQAANSVGPSYRSYTWEAKQWALAIDAACQVSAVRQDVWDGAGLGRMPQTWTEVAELAAALRTAPHKVAIPLNPNHSYCTFLSIGVSLVGEQFWPTGGHLQQAAAIEALSFLREITPRLHPASRSEDPIAISDRMAGSGDVVYVPLMFGYSSYSRPGFRANIVRFGDAPRGAGGNIGSVLGGVGLALSACSLNRDAAADLARHIASPQVQAGLYANAGGQPGHAAAWASPSVNEQAGDFFVSTRPTMNHAFLRPRIAGHRRFQELAGELIYRFLWVQDISDRECLAQYGRLVDSLLIGAERAGAA